MRDLQATVLGVVTCLLLNLLLETPGESAQYLPIESLLDTFDGIIQVENPHPVGHPYQTEIVTSDKLAKTVSLTAFCKD